MPLRKSVVLALLFTLVGLGAIVGHTALAQTSPPTAATAPIKTGSVGGTTPYIEAGTLSGGGTPDALALRITGTEYMRLTSTGSVGIGTSTPKATLEVAGGVRLSNDAATCDSNKSGTLRWTGSAFQHCNGSSWTSVSTASQATYDSGVKLLLHMDGTNDSTTFTDSSILGRSGTATGATLSTASTKFGTASGYFSGSNAYVSFADSDDWNFGTGDFTIDAWINRSETVGAVTRNITAQRDGPDTTEIFFNIQTGNQLCYVDWQTSHKINLCSAALSWTAGQWYHVAVVRSGNTFTIYRDGTSVATTTTTNAMSDAPAPFVVGTDPTVTTRSFYGYIDELRVTKGVARWTSNFTPPTSAYDTSSVSCPYIAPGSQLFTSSGTFTPPSGVSEQCPLSVRVAMIGGGGGGGIGCNSCNSHGGGGGGSGNFVASSLLLTSSATVAVTVGAGASGTHGTPTSFGSLTVSGGSAGRNCIASVGQGAGGDGAGGGGTGGWYGSVGSAGGAIGTGSGATAELTSGTIVSSTNLMGILFQSATFAAGTAGSGGPVAFGGGGTGGSGYGGGGGGGNGNYDCGWSTQSGGGGGGGGGLRINGAGPTASTGNGAAAGGAGAPGAVYVEWGPTVCTPASTCTLGSLSLYAYAANCSGATTKCRVGTNCTAGETPVTCANNGCGGTTSYVRVQTWADGSMMCYNRPDCMGTQPMKCAISSTP